MKLRLATENDKNALYRLWEEAFGDGEEDIDLFFDSVITADNTAVAEADGTVVSALYLIDAEIVCGETAYSAYYVYAAATDKRYRNQGIMGRLLEYGSEIASERGVDYLFLHPAEESLYGYYSKNGFKTALYDKPGNPYVRWGEDIIELNRVLYGEDGSEERENSGDGTAHRTGMIKKINGAAPEIGSAYLGITLE